MTSRSAARSAIKFKSLCLNCGSPADSADYVCGRCHEEWHRKYRAIDLQMVYNARIKQQLQRSYSDFDLNHPEGILQYAGLPNRPEDHHSVLPVGLTPLLHLNNLSRLYNVNLFLKAEGFNPSGCFKDRETLMCLLNSINNGKEKAVIYSSGNAAASAAVFAQHSGFKLITFVSGDTYPEKIDYIRKHGSDVIVIGNETTTFEDGYSIYAGINAMGFFKENGFDDWSVRNPYRVQGDKVTALEIIKQLGEDKVPDYVIVPTANGTCLAGIWKGFRELQQLGIIDKLPKMVSAGIRKANPVFAAVRRGETKKPVHCDLSKVNSRDAMIGSIILAEEGYDSIQATRAVLDSEGMAVELGSEDLEEVLKLFLTREEKLSREYNLVPAPVSLLSIAAVARLKEQVHVDDDTIIVSIVTGSGVKARERINELLDDDSLQEQADRLLDKKAKQHLAEAENMGRLREVEEDFESVLKAFYNLKG